MNVQYFWYIVTQGNTERKSVTWPKYCRDGVKHDPNNQ